MRSGAATFVKFVESGFEGRQSISWQAPCPSSGRSPLNAPAEPGQTQCFEQSPHALGDVRFTVAGVMRKKARRSLSVWLEFVPSLAGMRALVFARSALLIHSLPKPRSRRLKKPRNCNKMRMMPGSSPLEYFERLSEWS
jgi:hypothetical protein